MKQEEIDRILNALPKTEDGVHMVPGMKVWYMCTHRTDNPVDYSTVREVRDDGSWGNRPHFVGDGKQPIFSEEQMALDWRAKCYADKADAAIKLAKEGAIGLTLK